MICDFLGAGRAYMGKLFTAEKEYGWWTNEGAVLHEDTRYFVEDTLQRMMVDGIEPVLKDIFKNRYLFKIWYKSLVHRKKPFKEWQKWQKSSGL